MKIAIVGAGISGLGAAWLLAKKHDVTLFEADSHFGGHANTVNVSCSNGVVPVDTGFIVCNNRNYPNFLALLDQLKVKYVPTEMSFGVSLGNGNFEYAGSEKLNAMLAQPLNIFRPRFISMIKSLVRFYKETSEIKNEDVAGITLKDYLNQNNYSAGFVRDHILPMAAAIWSTPSKKVADFPLTSFLRFCQNHGLLQIKDRPQWYTINGGSKCYVSAIIENTRANFQKNTKVTAIRRKSGQVEIVTSDGQVKIFDRVLIATHANTATNIIKDMDSIEEDILSRFSYAKNRAVLHSDPSFMPKRKKAWSSWNYLQEDENDDERLSVTYWMNKLQPLDTDQPLFVTLNPSREPDPALVHYEKMYDHPIFDLNTLEAQKRLLDIMGHRQIWYAGAHFGYGFHEDGLQSGLYAAEKLGEISRPWNIPDMNGRIIAVDGQIEIEDQLAGAAE